MTAQEKSSRLAKLYKQLSTELLQSRLASLTKDIAENRAENMLFDRATAEKQAAVITAILAKR